MVENSGETGHDDDGREDRKRDEAVDEERPLDIEDGLLAERKGPGEIPEHEARTFVGGFRHEDEGLPDDHEELFTESRS